MYDSIPITEPAADRRCTAAGAAALDPVCQLEREWSSLERGALAAALPRWREQHAALRCFGSPGQLLRFLNSSRPDQTDEPLGALLWLAREEQLAGRFVLQAILPALKAQAGRIAADPAAREEVWELLLFFAWEAICCYPLQRRSRVAANLVLQVLHDTTRELRPARLQSIPSSPRGRTLTDALLGVPSTELAVQPQDAALTTVERLAAEALLVAAVAADAIAERDAQLILQTRIDGISLRLIARTLGVGYHALRQRRQRAERRLRELLGPGRDVSKTDVSDLISTAEFASTPARPELPDTPARQAA